MSKMETLIGMALIGIVSITAMNHGFDGQVAYLAIVAIAGLGGYQIREATK